MHSLPVASVLTVTVTTSLPAPEPCPIRQVAPPVWACEERGSLTAPAASCGVAALLAALVLVARPYEVVAYARAHEAFIIGAATIGALGLLVPSALMLGVRR